MVCWATSAETDDTQCGVQLRTTAASCVSLRRTLVEELVHACRGSGGMLLTHVMALLACSSVKSQHWPAGKALSQPSHHWVCSGT